jgi:DNA-binding transcriptional LysR family regulator
MDARNLKYFLAVADAGSVTRAADRLNIAQPALYGALKAKPFRGPVFRQSSPVG